MFFIFCRQIYNCVPYPVIEPHITMNIYFQIIFSLSAVFVNTVCSAHYLILPLTATRKKFTTQRKGSLNILILIKPPLLQDYKNLSWMRGTDKKIRPGGYCSASFGIASRCRTMIPRDDFFHPHRTSMIDSFSFIPFDLHFDFNHSFRFLV